MLLTLVAFVVALGLLIAAHEYGHYRVAVACGVKVLRFSVGFGKPLLRWQPKGSPTEFVLSAFPLGGYVRMLDEREAPVPEAERHLAFNTQPLRSRAAIVAAGPIANLLLAVLLYSVVNWSGVQEPKALLASPVAGSVAQAAGLRGGELVHGAALGSGELEPVRSFEDLRWLLTRGALEGERVRLEVEPTPGALHREVLLDMEQIDAREADAQLFRKVGLLGPWTRPVLGEIMADSAAQRAGLRQGDVVQKIAYLGCVDSHLAHDGAHADWRGVSQEPQRPFDHCRLCRSLRRDGIDAVPCLPRAHQREPGRAEPVTSASARWRAPDVLSLGGSHWQKCLRHLDGVPPAWRRGSACLDDVYRTF
jgi:regulator of sigma E protease